MTFRTLAQPREVVKGPQHRRETLRENPSRRALPGVGLQLRDDALEELPLPLVVIRRHCFERCVLCALLRISLQELPSESVTGVPVGPSSCEHYISIRGAPVDAPPASRDGINPVGRRADTFGMEAGQLKSAFLLPPVIVGLYLLHTAWSWGLAGAIAVVVGTLVAADYRGIAGRVPWVLGASRLGFNRSVGARRRSFALLALWGVVMILLALR